MILIFTLAGVYFANFGFTLTNMGKMNYRQSGFVSFLYWVYFSKSMLHIMLQVIIMQVFFRNTRLINLFFNVN